MLNKDFSLEVLSEKIDGKIYGSSDFKTSNLTGVFTTLNEAKKGDIVIRHWINGKGVEIANSKEVACLITLNPTSDALTMAESLDYPVIVVSKIEVANAFALEQTINKFAPDSKRVVITGTNGKSTTSDMIYHILNHSGRNVFTNTDARSEFNTLIDPMVSRLIVKRASELESLDYLVIEVSEVQGWEDYFMKGHAEFMASAINPDVAVVTNVAMDHIGLVNSVSEVSSEISSYVKVLNHGVVVLNSDDENVFKMRSVVCEDCDTFYLTMDSSKLSSIPGSDKFKLSYSDDLKAIIYEGDVFLELKDLPFQSHHFIQNTLSAIASAISLNIPLDNIKEGVKSYESLKRRFVTLKNNPLIIDDFAHNPQGIKATIESAFNLASSENFENLFIVNAIRGSRGLSLNKLISESLVEIINKLSNTGGVSINLSLSCSEDVVDNLNTVTNEEKEVFTKVLDDNNINYTIYDYLISALKDVTSSAGDNDLILLIGAQGMDPAEGLLKEINVI